MSNAAQPAPSEPLVLEAREGAIAVLTMNRPDRLNALNTELGTALVQALDRVAKDPSIRVVVLTGAGRAFCWEAILPPSARREIEERRGSSSRCCARGTRWSSGCAR